MKKIFSFAAVMAFGIAVSFGQTAVSSSTTESATPVIKVTDATGTVKCSTDSKTGSCCSSAKTSTSSASASATSTEVKAAGACCSGHTDGAEAKTEGANCHSATMQMGAAQPAKVEETPEK